MGFFSKLSGRRKPAQGNAPVNENKKPITFLAFEDSNQLTDHMAQYIQDKNPEIVLIAGPGASKYFKLDKLKESVPKNYEVLVNEECKIRWLTDTMQSLRNKKGSHSIVISNFPTRFVDMVEVSGYNSRSGRFTIQIPGKDVLLPFNRQAVEISMVIFWQGRAALSYIESVYSYFLKGRRGLAELFCLWNLRGDSKLASAESEKIKILNLEINARP
jgi:hypothetical protein